MANRRLLAYHLVPEELFESIVEKGKILPAIGRLDPSQIKEDCESFLFDVEHYGETEPVKKTLSALRSLIVEKVRDLKEHQKQKGIKPIRIETQFHCADFLADDLDAVFLSVHGWLEWVEIPEHGRWPTGFVFDAEELVRLGARVRDYDFGARYGTEIERAVSYSYEEPEIAKHAIMRFLANVKQGEMSGRFALSFLKEWKRGADDLPEIVWRGPLPLHYAVQAWHSGRSIPRTTR